MSKQFLEDEGVDLIVGKWPCDMCLVRAPCKSNGRDCQDYQKFVNNATDNFCLLCDEEREYLKSLPDYVMLTINSFREAQVRYGTTDWRYNYNLDESQR